MYTADIAEFLEVIKRNTGFDTVFWKELNSNQWQMYILTRTDGLRYEGVVIPDTLHIDDIKAKIWKYVERLRLTLVREEK